MCCTAYMIRTRRASYYLLGTCMGYNRDTSLHIHASSSKVASSDTLAGITAVVCSGQNSIGPSEGLNGLEDVNQEKVPLEYLHSSILTCMYYQYSWTCLKWCELQEPIYSIQTLENGLQYRHRQ
jgi:hypothetical protein